MITITHLSKCYAGGDVTALFVEDMRIAASQRLAVTGPSGSGKSTLLSILGGILAPTSGEILWDGESWLKKAGELSSRERARRIGFVFQDLNLLPGLSVHDNLLAAAGFLGVDAGVRKVREVVELVGLTERVRHRPEALSRGERQRAAVARAMLYPHRLVIADEPTASLDERNATLVMELLIAMSRRTGGALVVATHDPRMAAMLPSRFELARCDGDVIAARSA